MRRQIATIVSCRWASLAFVFTILLAGCGGGGGAGGKGTLALLVTGLPAGAEPALTVTADNGYVRTLAAATTLTDVPAGLAVVAAANVTVGAATYAATLSAGEVTIVAGATSTVVVTYAVLPAGASTGSVSVAVSGLPAGVAAAIAIAGQGGYVRDAIGDFTFDTVPVGAASVSAGAVAVGGTTYAATVTGSPLTVAPGGTYSVGVAYAPIAPAATRVVSGTARFESVPLSTIGTLDYPGTVVRPIRGAVVEILASPSQALLAATETSDSGAFSAEIDASTASFFVRVKARMARSGAPGWSFTVADNTNGEATWVLDTAPQNLNGADAVVDPLAGSGWTGSSYGEPRASAPFAILDTVYEAHRKTLPVAPSQVWPNLMVLWSPNNRPVNSPAQRDPAAGLITTTLYNGETGGMHRIYVLGKADLDTDEFDRHVVAHEFGHYLQAVVSRDDSVGGAHGLGDRLDMRVAFSEGWGNAWAGIALDDPLYFDSSGPQQAVGGGFDVSAPDTQGPGWFKEDSLQYLVWQANQLIGLAPLWDTLAGPVRTALAFGSAHVFANGLKQIVPGAGAAIDNLFASQGIRVSDDFATGETNDGGNPDVLPVYKILSGRGASAQLCVGKVDGAPNKLGNTAFAKIEIATAGSYQFTLTGGVDPDFHLSDVTTTTSAESADVAIESLTTTLAAGTYVLAAYDYEMLFGASNATRQCLTLAVN